MESKVSVHINQKVAVLIDGNNIGRSAAQVHNQNLMLDFDAFIPQVLGERQLSKFYFFREGKAISEKFADRLHRNFYGIVVPCHKNADSVLTMTAIQIADKIDTIILFSGDADYLHLVRFLKIKGVRIELASFVKTTARALLSEVDFHHKIEKENLFEFKNEAAA